MCRGSTLRGLLLLLAPAWSASVGRAQSLPALDEYHLRVFGVADGLPNSDVEVLAQTRDGHIYAGSRGLTRYDGYEFEPVDLRGFRSSFVARLHADRRGRLWLFSISNDLGYIENGTLHILPPPQTRLREFSETGDGTVWIGSDDGLFRLTGDPVRIERFTRADGLPSDVVAGVYDVPDQGRVAVTADGLARVDASSFTPIGPHFRMLLGRDAPLVLASNGSPARSVHQDSSGLWIAFSDALIRYHGNRFESYRREAKPALRLDDLAWNVSGRAAPLWYLSSFMRNPAGLSAEMLAAGARVKQGLRAKDGARWFTISGVRDSADYLLRERAGELQEIPLRRYAAVREIQRLLEDQEGGIWIGTDRGLIQLAPRRLFALTGDHGLAEGVTTSILQTQDRAVWVGTWGGGLHRFANGRHTRRYTRRDGLPNDKVRGLYEAHDGTLWIATSVGIAALHSGRVVASSHTDGEMRSIAETPDGTLWAGGTRRLLRRTKGGWQEHRPEHWSARSIWALHSTRDGSLWIGSDDGLYRLVGDSLQTFGARDGLRSTFIVSIYEERDGTLWFGTDEHGLHRYRNGRFSAVTTGEGLHSNGIWRMLEDGRGGVWLSSDQGIARVDHGRLHDVADAIERGLQRRATLSPLLFTESEGMPSRECNRAAPGGWRLASGRLVFNNKAGLVVIDPARATAAAPPVRTVLKAVEADGRRVDVAAGTARVEPGTKQLAFDFAALSFTAPEQTRYRYRLDGYDDEWVGSGTRRRASYTNLQPGRYTFRVRGIGAGSDWNDAQEASLSVIVPPLIWQRWWFRVLLVLVLGSLLAVAYRYRVKHLLEMQRLRLRIASDLHDDVGSNLSSIALLSEMMREHAPARDELEERQLKRIGSAAEESIGALRDIIWLVNPKHDNLGDLVRRMRGVANDMLDGTPCHFEAPEQLERPVDMELIRNVYLIYKEAVTNIARHAKARRVEIQVNEERGKFGLRIRDDGRGFDQDTVRLGHGLENMRRRAEQAGGRIEIVSAPAEGTEIIFTTSMA